MQEFISQKLIVSIEKYPLHSSLNPKILKEIEDIPFNMSYETNVKAQMTDWSISTPSIEESFELMRFEKPSERHEIMIREAMPIERPNTPSTEVT